VNSFPLPVFLSEVNGETEEKTPFLLWKISLPSGGIQEQKTCRGGKTKQTKSMMKQDFPGEALSKQNIKAGLVSLLCDLSWVPTKWSAIFGIWCIPDRNPSNYTCSAFTVY